MLDKISEVRVRSGREGGGRRPVCGRQRANPGAPQDEVVKNLKNRYAQDEIYVRFTQPARRRVWRS
jgi:hypothetical protein